MNIIPNLDFDLAATYKILLLAVFLEARLVEHLIKLITEAHHEKIAAKAGLLLAEVDYLSSAYLPSPTVSNSVLSATSEIITSCLTRVVNEEKSSHRANRRAHQAIIWLKNYRRFKKIHYPLSIYLQHQLDLRRKRKNHDTVSEPNPAVASQNPHRPSIFHAKDKLVLLMKPTRTPLTKSRTFDNGNAIGYGTLNRKWSKWRAKTENFPRSPSKSDSSIPETNKFIEYVKETWVTKYPDEPNHWNWKILPHKLKCYDLIPIMVIYSDQPNDNQHAVETRKFFEKIVHYFTGDEFHKLKVEWEDVYWCEAEDIHSKITTGVNFIKLVGEMSEYFWNKRSKPLHETRKWLQDNIITELRTVLFQKLLELAKLTTFELRHLSSVG